MGYTSQTIGTDVSASDVLKWIEDNRDQPGVKITKTPQGVDITHQGESFSYTVGDIVPGRTSDRECFHALLDKASIGTLTGAAGYAAESTGNVLDTMSAIADVLSSTSVSEAARKARHASKSTRKTVGSIAEAPACASLIPSYAPDQTGKEPPHR